MEIKELKKVESRLESSASFRSLGHEQVVFCHDDTAGLKAIIAIHNTVLALPWVEHAWNYATEQEALTDDHCPFTRHDIQSVNLWL